jgi:ankyrin repeat protein
MALHDAFDMRDGDLVKKILQSAMNMGLFKNLDTVEINYRSLLNHACRCRLYTVVDFLLENGANVKHMDTSYQFPLQIACAYSSFEMVAFLLKRGVDVNQVNEYGISSLVSAKGNIDIIKLLLDNGADVNDDRLLFYACNESKLETVKLLLSYGADPKTDPLYFERSPIKVICQAFANRYINRYNHTELDMTILSMLKYGATLDILNIGLIVQIRIPRTLSLVFISRYKTDTPIFKGLKDPDHYCIDDTTNQISLKNDTIKKGYAITAINIADLNLQDHLIKDLIPIVLEFMTEDEIFSFPLFSQV